MQGAPWGSLLVRPMLIVAGVALATGLVLGQCAATRTEVVQQNIDTLKWDEILEGDPTKLVDRLFAATDAELSKRCGESFYPTRDSVRTELAKHPGKRGQMCGAYYSCTAHNLTWDGEWVEWDCLNGSRPLNLYEADPKKSERWLAAYCRKSVAAGEWGGFSDNPTTACREEMENSCPYEVCRPDDWRARMKATTPQDPRP